MKLLRLLACVLTVCLAAGCGSSAPATVAVSGLLKFEDGKPVSGASLRFVNTAGGREAVGNTGKDGAFNLSTFNTGDGAVVGEYTIVVTKIASSFDGGAVDNTAKKPEDMINMLKKGGIDGAPKKVEDPVPAVYSDVKTSPLKAKIDASTSSLNLVLKRS